MPDEALFDVPAEAYLVPPEPENLTRGEKRKRLVAKRIANGEHPLGRPVYLHPDASREGTFFDGQGPRCGGCKFRVIVEHNTRSYPKCWYPDVDSYPHPRDSGCESSDIRRWWPACRQYEEKK